VYHINEVGELPSGALEQLELADAIIYGSPTYMGGIQAAAAPHAWNR
jgi:hypothetical protein